MLTAFTGLDAQPVWNLPTNLHYNMQVVGKPQWLDGTISNNSNDLMDIFVGNKPRGVALDGRMFLYITFNHTVEKCAVSKPGTAARPKHQSSSRRTCSQIKVKPAATTTRSFSPSHRNRYPPPTPSQPEPTAVSSLKV